ncbi:MAG: adenosylcobinamide-phosphate synthase CbiB [Deltaproteobacteria bacterium]|nr:adenosylcobinamide-phosphate synthase CbiB [Deltaproteobacteria bacterium]
MNFLHFDSSIIFFAFLLDLLLGDPRWFPHPVVIIGRGISLGETILRRFAKVKTAEILAGMILAVIIPVSAFVAVDFIIKLTSHIHHWAGWFAAVLLGYTTIAAKSLYAESRKVAKRLSVGDIQGARKELSYLVGRDTQNLDGREIVRGLVETVAENTSDGVIAPLFYLAIGGPPLAMAYKAVNTLDSMVGYKNERYLYFGRASARLDDLVNYIPARLTALLIAFAAFVLRKDWRGAWKIMLRDRRNHPSPNSGYPEAAVAGALGRRLGGLSYYGGVPSNKPFIGDEHGEFQVIDVKDAGRLMITSSILMVLLSILIIAVLGQRCVN